MTIKNNIKRIYPSIKNLKSRYVGLQDRFGDSVANGYSGLGNCGYFDGNTYCLGGTGSIHNGTELLVECGFYLDDLIGLKTIIAKYDSVDGPKLEFMLFVSGTMITVILVDGTGTAESVTFDTLAVAGYNEVRTIINGNVITAVVNGVDELLTFTTLDGTINSTTAPVSVGGWNSGLYPMAGIILFAYAGSVKYNINHQWGDKIYDIGIDENHATLVGPTKEVFWGKSQSKFNALDKIGYSLYRHVSDTITNMDILVPFKDASNVTIPATIPDYVKMGEIRGRLRYDLALVNSPTGVWDGNGYAMGGSDNLHTSTYLKFDVIFKEKSETDEKPLMAKWDVDGRRSFYVGSASRHISIATSNNGTDQQNITLPPILIVGKIYHLDGEFNNGNLTGTIQELNQNGKVDVNGVRIPFSFTVNDNTLFLGNDDINFSIGTTLIDELPYSTLRYTDDIYYVRYGSAEFDMNHSNGYILYNKGSGSDCELIGFDLLEFWKGEQNLLHQAYNDGFDRWVNGTMRMQVHVGVIVNQPGWSFESTHPHINGHNGAPTDYQLSKAHQNTQNITPISSITGNKNLRWVNGEIVGFVRTTTGTSVIESVLNGTRFHSPNNDVAFMKQSNVLSPGKIYEYALMVHSVVGSLRMYTAGYSATYTSAGIKRGTISTVSDYIAITITALGDDFTISNFFVWEKGTIPPLSFDEIDENSANVNTTFCDVSVTNQKRNLTIYTEPLEDDELKSLKFFLNQ